MSRYRDPLTEAETRIKRRDQEILKERLLDSMGRMWFRASHIERHAHEAEWLCRLVGEGEDGTPARGLHLTIRTPSPLDFGLRYEWAMLAVCPYWVEYWATPGRTVRFSGNQRKK